MGFSFKAPLVLDGATGTNLQKLGMPMGACTPAWILEHPEAIVGLKRSYIEAGSDLIYAPTFGVDRLSLARHGIETSVYDMCSRLIELARRDLGDIPLGGDLAPTGAMPEPYGSNSFDEMVEVFAEPMRAMETAGVDFFIIETQINLEEARAAVTAAKAVTKKPVFVCFSCNESGKSFWGDDLAEAVTVLEPMGIDAYGINCCGDLALLERVIGEIRKKTSLPLIAKPNAGLPEQINGETVYKMTPEELAAHIPALLEAGATMLGGCCGTTAEHIRAIAEILKA